MEACRWSRLQKKNGIDQFAEISLYDAYNLYVDGKYGEYIDAMNDACGGGNGDVLAWKYLLEQLAPNPYIVSEMAKVYVKHSGKYAIEASKYIIEK